MLTNVFKAQIWKPLKDDWIELVKKDLIDFNINDTFDEISKIKEDIFKKRVATACKNYALKKLVSEKDRHSKGEHLTFN